MKNRNYCFTIFNENEKKFMMDFVSEVVSNVDGNTIHRHASYVCFGVEICPKT